ncbi:TetR/AcrR family transcriptional regulator [Labedella endophytica]|uniref:TetR/AcrR family transcriptional regulator n=1 Tax=Labedella endophytica TaxID=1523160 RepID=A0A3S1CS17_9MICO|nr:TetR/AcrR family transcriptional regulator [Labedella endophytica]RUR00997.1 TetR/AcrR family transcriptional regulator [Labedella endophytica]
MARTQAFERDDVVRAARTVFWRTGFDAASIPELETATGLNRSSLYNTFGSKRGLFDVAVQSYLDEVVRPRLRPLRADRVEHEAILYYLDCLRTAFENLDSPSASNGCLLINTAGSPIARDEEVARIVSDYRSELREAIGAGVTAFMGAPPSPESERLSDSTTGLVVAAFALARVAPGEASRLLQTAREQITAVRAA